MFQKILLIIVGLYILASTLAIGYLYSFKTNEISKAVQLGSNQTITEMNNSIIDQIKTNGFLPLSINGQTVNLVPYTGTSTAK